MMGWKEKLLGKPQQRQETTTVGPTPTRDEGLIETRRDTRIAANNLMATLRGEAEACSARLCREPPHSAEE